MSEIYFVIDGAVQPKQRPRVVRRKVKADKGYVTKVFTFTPDATRNYEDRVKNAYLSEYPAGMAFKDEPLEMILNVYIAVPKSYSKKKRDKMILSEFPNKHNGDVDNLIKSIADALNGTAYTDDCQIVHVNVWKLWSEESRAEVTIRSLKK